MRTEPAALQRFLRLDQQPAQRRSLIVAMDHASVLGHTAGLERPEIIIEGAIAAGANGLLTTCGQMKRYRQRLQGAIPLLMRVDGGPKPDSDGWLPYREWDLLHSVAAAEKFGATGVVAMLFLGGELAMQSLRVVAQVADECAAAKLTLMVEALPSRAYPDPLAPQAVADAARIAFEQGADLIKTYYTGSAAGFRSVVATCPVPLLVAGGPKMENWDETRTLVGGALQAGAAGVVFGRTIWQGATTAEDIATTIRALRMELQSH